MTDEHGVSSRECAAMRHLARDGYSPDVLKMTMHVCSPSTVRHHVTGACVHHHDIPPIPDWDGEAPADPTSDGLEVADD